MHTITARPASRPATHLVTAPSRVRAATFVALGVCLAALVAAVVLALVAASAAGASRTFSPSAADGLIPEGAAVGIEDASLPAVAQLTPALRQAMTDAAAEAATEGVTLDITSGWRSVAYQRWLFDSAVETYGDREVAGQYVAAPEDSTHITGEAVDIGSWDAQAWLAEHGSRFGLCRTYANEPWHFERAAEPGGACPAAVRDATVPRG